MVALRHYTENMPRESETTRTHTNLRLPHDLLAEMRKLARANERSLNSEIVVALRQYVERQKQKSARDDSER